MSVLDDILAELHESVLQQRIDAPIMTVLANLNWEALSPLTHAHFNTLIQSIHEQMAIRSEPDLMDKPAEHRHSEIYWILENHYRGLELNGYDGAYWDACNIVANNPDDLLQRLLGAYISRTRANYIAWVLQTRIDPGDWGLKVNIISEILTTFNHLLHPDLLGLPTAQLVPHLDELIMLIAQPLQLPKAFLFRPVSRPS